MTLRYFSFCGLVICFFVMLTFNLSFLCIQSDTVRMTLFALDPLLTAITQSSAYLVKWSHTQKTRQKICLVDCMHVSIYFFLFTPRVLADRPLRAPPPALPPSLPGVYSTGPRTVSARFPVLRSDLRQVLSPAQ